MSSTSKECFRKARNKTEQTLDIVPYSTLGMGKISRWRLSDFTVIPLLSDASEIPGGSLYVSLPLLPFFPPTFPFFFSSFFFHSLFSTIACICPLVSSLLGTGVKAINLAHPCALRTHGSGNA